MRFVIRLALTNVANKTGGPFGAALFETTTGRLIAVQDNVVEPTNCSFRSRRNGDAHGCTPSPETFNRGANGMPTLELVTVVNRAPSGKEELFGQGSTALSVMRERPTQQQSDEAPKPETRRRR